MLQNAMPRGMSFCSGAHIRASQDVLLRMAGGIGTLDLHELSEGAATLVVRWWLSEEIPRHRQVPARLEMITGYGKF